MKISPKQIDIEKLNKVIVTERYPTFVFGAIATGRMGSPLGVDFNGYIKEIKAYCISAGEGLTELTVNVKSPDGEWVSIIPNGETLKVTEGDVKIARHILEEPVFISKDSFLQVEFIESDQKLVNLTVQLTISEVK